MEPQSIQELLITLLITLQDFVINSGLSLIWAIIILFGGYWLSGIGERVVRTVLNKGRVNPSVVPFVATLIHYGIIIFATLAALEQIGIETTSIIALLGAAGLAIGLALEGTLSNFAAGFLILIFRPFKVGDFVEISSSFGKVEEIRIFNTIIVTLDNKTVIVPNSDITGTSIINYSQKGKIRLDMVFGIGYGDNLLKAKQILTEITTADSRVMKYPAPIVAVLELGDNSVNFAVRPHVKIEDYWPVLFDITEQVKLRFDQEGISIPFPQRDVHLFQQKS